VARASAWVGLSEAARILGAHPATVRGWADRGDLPSQRTPGGHRRFRRADLVEWMAYQSLPSAGDAHLLVQNMIGRAQAQIGDDLLLRAERFQCLDGEARATVISHLRRLVDAMQHYLTTPDGTLAEAQQIGKEYGQFVRQHRLTLVQTVEGFFAFNDFVLDTLLQMAEVSRPGAAQIDAIRRTCVFMRTITRSLIEAYQG
jgi:excisionase family DNA binding protein